MIKASVGPLQAEVKELRRLWIETEERTVKLSVRLAELEAKIPARPLKR